MFFATSAQLVAHIDIKIGLMKPHGYQFLRAQSQTVREEKCSFKKNSRYNEVSVVSGRVIYASSYEAIACVVIRVIRTEPFDEYSSSKFDIRWFDRSNICWLNKVRHSMRFDIRYSMVRSIEYLEDSKRFDIR